MSGPADFQRLRRSTGRNPFASVRKHYRPLTRRAANLGTPETLAEGVVDQRRL
ncbi:MAG: hypothetical protein NZ703_13145 [Gemmataceae bacterium]|nr:hypothetical protein [Gemmataceae bacterium]MCS7272020.1 hypothetical protein [Gemmataceae bacterium]MDW8242283.1 hypothetical protein [Thermogemmata sp.]